MGRKRLTPKNQNNQIQYFEVEAIKDFRLNSVGQRQYLIKWKRFDEKDNTWQPLLHLNPYIDVKKWQETHPTIISKRQKQYRQKICGRNKGNYVQKKEENIDLQDQQSFSEKYKKRKQKSIKKQKKQKKYKKRQGLNQINNMRQTRRQHQKNKQISLVQNNSDNQEQKKPINILNIIRGQRQKSNTLPSQKISKLIKKQEKQPPKISLTNYFDFQNQKSSQTGLQKIHYRARIKSSHSIQKRKQIRQEKQKKIQSIQKISKQINKNGQNAQNVQNESEKYIQKIQKKQCNEDHQEISQMINQVKDLEQRQIQSLSDNIDEQQPRQSVQYHYKNKEHSCIIQEQDYSSSNQQMLDKFQTQDKLKRQQFQFSQKQLSERQSYSQQNEQIQHKKQDIKQSQLSPENKSNPSDKNQNHDIIFTPNKDKNASVNSTNIKKSLNFEQGDEKILSNIFKNIISSSQLSNLSIRKLTKIHRYFKLQDVPIFSVQLNDNPEQRYICYELIRQYFPFNLLKYLEEEGKIVL